MALFAALSYAVTQSGRGGGSVDREQSLLRASEILQYTSQIKAATDRLRLVNGCDLTELSFQADWNEDGLDQPIAADQVNSNTPADGSCRYFHTNGAGLSLVRRPRLARQF